MDIFSWHIFTKASLHVGANIEFIVLHQHDPIRFWVWLFDDEQKRCMVRKGWFKLEEYISQTAPRSSAPLTYPHPSERGISLYQNTNWYRCFVVKASTEGDKFKEFFCDYGNTGEKHKHS